MSKAFTVFKVIDKALNFGLKIKRELRASRNESRAAKREQRAETRFEERPKKTYFGRDVEVHPSDSTTGDT